MTAVTGEDVLRDVELDDIIASAMSDAEPEPLAPDTQTIRVLKGELTDIELAALIAVLSAASVASVAPVTDSRPPELWGTPTFMHRGVSPFSPYSFPHLSHLRD